MDSESHFFVFWHMQLYMSWYIRSFFGFTFLNILYFFKYSSTNIFHRRSLYTFYMVWLTPCKHHPPDLMICLGTFVEVINIMWYIDVYIAINGLLSLFKQNDYNLLWYNDTGSRRYGSSEVPLHISFHCRESYFTAASFIFIAASFILVPRVLSYRREIYFTAARFILMPRVLFYCREFYITAASFVLPPRVLFSPPRL